MERVDDAPGLRDALSRLHARLRHLPCEHTDPTVTPQSDAGTHPFFDAHGPL
jgi:hypothetical protein